MEPTRSGQATLSDLLERLLDKGLVLNLDLIIGVADVPLIGINLRAAIASVETMIAYGFFAGWDAAAREAAQRELAHRKGRQNFPADRYGEIWLQMPGSHWYSGGIYQAWRTGTFYLTDRALVLYRREPPEILWQAGLADIRGLNIEAQAHFTGSTREVLCLTLESGRGVLIVAEDVRQLGEAIISAQQAGGLTPAARSEGAAEVSLPPDGEGGEALPGEVALRSGKMWYRLPGSGLFGPTWKPGWLYLTPARLAWYAPLEKKWLLAIPVPAITAVAASAATVGLDPNVPVMAVSFQQSPGVTNKAFFSSSREEIAAWLELLRRYTGE